MCSGPGETGFFVREPDKSGLHRGNRLFAGGRRAGAARVSLKSLDLATPGCRSLQISRRSATFVRRACAASGQAAAAPPRSLMKSRFWSRLFAVLASEFTSVGQLVDKVDELRNSPIS